MQVPEATFWSLSALQVAASACEIFTMAGFTSRNWAEPPVRHCVMCSATVPLDQCLQDRDVSLTQVPTVAACTADAVCCTLCAATRRKSPSSAKAVETNTTAESNPTLENCLPMCHILEESPVVMQEPLPTSILSGKTSRPHLHFHAEPVKLAVSWPSAGLNANQASPHAWA